MNMSPPNYPSSYGLLCSKEMASCVKQFYLISEKHGK